jgi:isopenicillin-N epimerase
MNKQFRGEDFSRRKFMKLLVGSVTVSSIMPHLSFAEGQASLKALGETAAELSGFQETDEKFWELVKEYFPLRKGLIMMNAANLCPSPWVVQQSVFQYSQDIDADPSFHNRAKFIKMKEEARKAIAQYLNADPDEIAITRNTTEGNNIVVAGLSFKKGDEVLIWDENHPTANVAWEVRAERYGFNVKKVSTPRHPRNKDELLETFKKALTGRTRILAFSHISNYSGVAMPAQELCQMAQEHGILSLVDGAQTFGAISLSLHDMGCDFYTGSAHKWLCGPKEVGILYVRKKRVGELWPLMVGDGWEEEVKGNARKFEAQGQRDDARVAGLGKTIEFHNAIGKERIEARIRALATAMKDEVQKKISVAKLVTPIEPELSGGIVVLSVPGIERMDSGTVLETLYQKYNISCNVLPLGIRMSPHIYNTMKEVEWVVAALRDFV